MSSATSPELSLRRPRRIAFDLERLGAAAPLSGLLVLTGVLYLWALSRNGWANEYYAAAVQAGTHSWKAFLFGSLDAANYITVDKPPASLWLMELSTRMLGLSSFSMLLPQALEGVAAVGLLYATVQRWFGRRAALLSGLILALTPVAALMFRFNNPDALLVLLLVLAAYALTRALENGATGWLALAGCAVGFGFLTKELQAFLVLPAFALVYLLAAPVRLGRRIWQLALAGGALVVSAGWWVALVELWPASTRPYIGGSTDNSVLQLIFGYNGLERISSGGSGPGGIGFSGSAGIFRLFNAQLGGQISWLLPGALIALIAGAVWTVRRPRSDRTRAFLLLWGGWLIVTAAVYSFMTGVIHPYYTNLLAPPIAALLGVAVALLWRRRDQLAARLVLAAMLAATGVWTCVLLARSPHWHPWLRFAILAGSLLATIALLTGGRLGNRSRLALAAVGLTAALAGPLAYTLSSVASAETGSNPSAGPAVASAGRFGPGGGVAGPPGRGPGASPTGGLVSLLERGSSGYTWVAATASAQSAASLELATGRSIMAIGGFSGSDRSTTLSRFERSVAEGKIHYYVAGGGLAGGIPGAGGGIPGVGSDLPGAGGGLGGSFPGIGPGGPALGPPGGARPGGRSAGGPGGGAKTVASQIQSWVASHFKSQTIGGMTVYNLSRPKVA